MYDVIVSWQVNAPPELFYTVIAQTLNIYYMPSTKLMSFLNFITQRELEF